MHACLVRSFGGNESWRAYNTGRIGSRACWSVKQPTSGSALGKPGCLRGGVLSRKAWKRWRFSCKRAATTRYAPPPHPHPLSFILRRSTAADAVSLVGVTPGLLTQNPLSYHSTPPPPPPPPHHRDASAGRKSSLRIISTSSPARSGGWNGSSKLPRLNRGSSRSSRRTQTRCGRS